MKLQSEHIAQKYAAEVIEKTVSDYLENNKFTYCDFAAVLYDDKKKVTAIETLPYNINKVQSVLGCLINEKLEETNRKNAEISIGSLTGSGILTGKGPKIKIRISPIGSAHINIKSEFTDAGINQTCHRIFALITVKMTSAVPLYSFDTSTDFKFLIAENIIVGSVPNMTPITTYDDD
ncbi:MAG: sporulation protein YunB [Ruminococcus sp.]|nr:sporulation protein YunB [Ruminococcus sp.]